MLNDGTRIDLVTRLRRMSGVLDILVPESPSAALEVCGLAEAITLLEKDGTRRWSRSMGQLCRAAFGTMQNDSGGMNTCFSIRMAMLQVHCGCFDEAIEQWFTIEEEHCA